MKSWKVVLELVAAGWGLAEAIAKVYEHIKK